VKGDLLPVPVDGLVLLVGPSGAGKSTFAARWFPPEAVLSSDAHRARVSGEEADQSATRAAFRLLHGAADARLAAGRLTVIDATNLLASARAPLLVMAERHARPTVALVFDLPLATCLVRNAQRPGRQVGDWVIRRQHAALRHALPQLGREGIRVHRFPSAEAVARTRVSITSRA
jgi:predicted kinase